MKCDAGFFIHFYSIVLIMIYLFLMQSCLFHIWFQYLI